MFSSRFSEAHPDSFAPLTHDSAMGNLLFGSRFTETTSTTSTERKLSPMVNCGLSPHEKESTARYNGAQTGTVSGEDSGDLTKHSDDEPLRQPVVLVKDTPEAEVRPRTSLFEVVPETPGMSRTASLDSAYGSRK